MVTAEIEQRWPITADERRQVVEFVIDIATNSTDPRERLAAVRVVLAMEAQNISDERSQDRHLRLAVERLALERGVLLP